MADELATVDQLLAVLQALRALYAASRDEGATLAEEQAATREILCAIADQTKVRQTLFNLLSNAAKFTERGTIHVRVARGGGLDRGSATLTTGARRRAG